MEMSGMSVSCLAELTARPAPSPAGVSVCAMTAAYSAALAQKLFACAMRRGQDSLAPMKDECEALRLELLKDMQRDGDAYKGYLAAKRLPDGDDKPIRLQAALREAIEVPLDIAKKALLVAGLLRLAQRHCPQAAIADGQAALYLTEAAAKACLLAARVNARLRTDKETGNSYVKLIDDLSQALAEDNKKP